MSETVQKKIVIRSATARTYPYELLSYKTAEKAVLSRVAAKLYKQLMDEGLIQTRILHTGPGGILVEAVLTVPEVAL